MFINHCGTFFNYNKIRIYYKFDLKIRTTFTFIYFCRIEGSEQLIESIICATGTKLNEYLNDIRMQICTFSKEIKRIQIILYVTNAPFDELFELFDVNSYIADIDQIELCREAFMKKIKVTTNEDTMSKSAVNDRSLYKI